MAGSRVRIEQDRPPEHFPGGETMREAAQAFAPGQVPAQEPVTPPSGIKTGSILLVPGVGSATHCVSGNPITLKDLHAVNSAFTDFIYSYPGGGGDKNDAQWVVPIPVDVAAVPNWRIRVHFLGG